MARTSGIGGEWPEIERKQNTRSAGHRGSQSKRRREKGVEDVRGPRLRVGTLEETVLFAELRRAYEHQLEEQGMTVHQLVPGRCWHLLAVSAWRGRIVAGELSRGQHQLCLLESLQSELLGLAQRKRLSIGRRWHSWNPVSKTSYISKSGRWKAIEEISRKNRRDPTARQLSARSLQRACRVTGVIRSVTRHRFAPALNFHVCAARFCIIGGIQPFNLDSTLIFDKDLQLNIPSNIDPAPGEPIAIFGVKQ
ncbi:hypothetical protein B0H13DRAFT_1882224 [Mycena leptocephala]|nr:hypothetical protein B0H13DRAFT_1882224 [Mycena leptocephala]